MDISITIFGGNPAHLAPMVRRADELGYDTVWIGDHLVTPLAYAHNYPHDKSGKPGYTEETPIMDPFVSIGYLAAMTKRIKFGTGVYILPLRHPFVTARSVVSAHYYAGGRLIFGIGTGWMEEEFKSAGEQFAHRGKRMDEILDILELLWSGKPVEHHGKFYDFPTVQFTPAPASRIPLVFGGKTDVALRRTAQRGDGW